MMLSPKGVLVNWKEGSRHVAAAGPRVSMESLEWNTSQRTKVAYLILVHKTSCGSVESQSNEHG